MSNFKLSPDEERIIKEAEERRREEERKRVEYINILDRIVNLTPVLEELQKLREQYPAVLTDEEFEVIYAVAKTIKIPDKSHERLLKFLKWNQRYDPTNKNIIRLVDTCIKDRETTQGSQWRFNAEKILNMIEREDRLNDPTVTIAEFQPKMPVED